MTQYRNRKTSNPKAPLLSSLLLLLVIALSDSCWAQSAPEKSTRTIHCMGQTWKIPVYSTSEEDIVLLKGDDNVLTQVARALGQSVSWSTSETALSSSLGKSLALGQTELDIHGRTETLKVVPAIVNGAVHIPSNGLEGLLDAKVTVKGQSIYVEPILRSMAYVEDSGSGTNLQILTSVPVRRKVFTLNSPKRTVIDLVGVAIPNGFEVPSHNMVGEVRVGQFQLTPAITRVVIPMEGKLKANATRSLDLFEHSIELSWPGSRRPIASAPKQTSERPKAIEIKPVSETVRRPAIKIKPVDDQQDQDTVALEPVEEDPDERSAEPDTAVVQERTTLNAINWEGSRLKLSFSQPVGYQWARVSAGQERFVIDFPGVIYPKKKVHLDSGVPGLQAVRVVQNMPEPQPIVRLVCDLEASIEVEAEGSDERILYLSFPGRKVSNARMDKGIGHTSKSYVASTGGGRTICIDAGHGGSDPGALNRSVGVNEKQVTLDICLKLAELLKAQGWNVILTRSSDRDVSWAGSTAKQELGARARMANDYGADLFVSVHANASVNASINGTSIHWYKSTDYRLASLLENGVMSGTGRKNRGLVKNRFYVLAHTTMPAVLIETAFLTNSTEGKLLASPEYRTRIARGIAAGLQVYASKTYSNPTARK